MKNQERVTLYVKEGITLLIEIIQRNYSYSTVGIVYEKEYQEDFYQIAKALANVGNKCQSLQLDEIKGADCFAEHVRFVLGIGTKKVALALQEIIGNRRFAFYCTEICPDYFSRGLFYEKALSFAQFAYFNTLIYGIENPKVLKSGYTTILSLLSSTLDIYCYKFLRPYKDIEIEVLIKQQKEFLFKSVDKTIYMKQQLTLIKNTVDYLNAYETTPLIYKIRKGEFESWTDKKEFILNYLLFYMGLIFTKWNINDMLIPSSASDLHSQLTTKVLLQQSTKILPAILNKAEINHISMVFRAMGEKFEDIDIKKEIQLIIRYSPYVEGFFREINNLGVLENIINHEENTRY